MRGWQMGAVLLAGLMFAETLQADEAGGLSYETLVEPIGLRETEEAALRERVRVADDAAAHVALAGFLHRHGDWKAGIELVEAALARWPDERRLQALRVELLLLRVSNAGLLGMAGAGKALRRACESDLARDPGNGDALLCLARYYAEAPGIAGGSKRKAEEMTERLRALGGAPWHLLEAQNAKDDREARIAALRQAVLARPEAGIFVNLAANLLAAGDREDALACIARALELHPDDAMLLYLAGRIAAETTSALAFGERSLLRFLSGPTFFGGRDYRAGGHWRLGMIFEATGRREQARAAFRRAISLDPKNGQFQETLDRLDATAAE